MRGGDAGVEGVFDDLAADGAVAGEQRLKISGKQTRLADRQLNSGETHVVTLFISYDCNRFPGPQSGLFKNGSAIPQDTRMLR